MGYQCLRLLCQIVLSDRMSALLHSKTPHASVWKYCIYFLLDSLLLLELKFGFMIITKVRCQQLFKDFDSNVCLMLLNLNTSNYDTLKIFSFLKPDPKHEKISKLQHLLWKIPSDILVYVPIEQWTCL